MSEKNWVDKDHYRITSDDGKQSWLYKSEGILFTHGTLIEIADHYEDGTTDAYEVAWGLFGPCKGNKKNDW